MKASYSFYNTIAPYKRIGSFKFNILPSTEINKDNVFKENYFVLEFYWLCFNFSIYFDKKEKNNVKVKKEL